MKKANLPSPIFKTKGIFSVVLNRMVSELNSEKTREKTRGKTRGKIIRLMTESSQITTNELAKIIGISAKGIEYHIAKLKTQGAIERTGSDKKGHWVILEIR